MPRILTFLLPSESVKFESDARVAMSTISIFSSVESST